jgi:hypothetical protein
LGQLKPFEKVVESEPIFFDREPDSNQDQIVIVGILYVIGGFLFLHWMTSAVDSHFSFFEINSVVREQSCAYFCNLKTNLNHVIKIGTPLVKLVWSQVLLVNFEIGKQIFEETHQPM